MSDTPEVLEDLAIVENTTPSGEPAADPAGQSQPQDPEITPELLDKMARSRDFNGLDKLGDKLNKANEQPAATPAAPSAKPAAPAQPAASSAPKKFAVPWKGQTIEVDDPDSLLGAGSTGALKKRFVKESLYRKEVEDTLAQVRSHAAASQAEAEDLRKQIAVLTAAQAAASKRPVEQPVAPAKKVELPPRPKMPEGLPRDFVDFTPEQTSAYLKWQDENSAYTEKLAGVLADMASQPVSAPAPTTVALPPEVEKEIQEFRTLRQTLAAEKERLKKEAEESSYWNSVATFTSRHKEFATDKPPRELHEDVVAWMDRVAVANGIAKPLFDQGPEHAAYLQQRNALVGKFLHGDKAVVEASQGVEPPSGYDKYFKMADLNARLRQYVADGMLGPKATLEAAYLLQMKDDGDLEKTLGDIRQESFASGASAVTDALTKHTQFASAVPPEMANQSGVPGDDVSSEDMTWFENVDIRMLKRMNADDRARYERIGKSLGYA